MIKKIVAWFIALAACIAIIWHFLRNKFITVTPDHIEKPDLPQDDTGTLTRDELEQILKDIRK